MALNIDCLHNLGTLFSVKHLLSISSSQLYKVGPRLFSCFTSTLYMAASFMFLGAAIPFLCSCCYFCMPSESYGRNGVTQIFRSFHRTVSSTTGGCSVVGTFLKCVFYIYHSEHYGLIFRGYHIVIIRFPRFHFVYIAIFFRKYTLPVFFFSESVDHATSSAASVCSTECLGLLDIVT